MQFVLKSAMAIVATLVLTLVVACDRETSPPLPTPVPVDALYDALRSEKEGNPTRLKSRVDSEENRSFAGPITNIEGGKVQFHIRKVAAEKDEYVECEFMSESDVLPLNKGDNVSVNGDLHKAFPTGALGDFGFKDSKAVKFKNCQLYSTN